MGLNVPDKTLRTLKAYPEQRLSARQIAQLIFDHFTEECRGKQNDSKAILKPLKDHAALISQIAAEVAAKIPALLRKKPNIRMIEGNPRLYYYTLTMENAESETAEEMTHTASVQNEHSLYPKVMKYLQSEFGLYCKRINEKLASNIRGRGSNKWLYPDIVGLEDLSQEWNDEVRQCVQQYADLKTRLWSFEVKTKLHSGIIRESFFQTLSNSCRANLAYLVTTEIDSAAFTEMRMLSARHGIGLIQLDPDDFERNQILIPAKEREKVDWDTVSRIATVSPCFRDYIKNIKHFYQTHHINPADWDKVS